MGPLFFVSYARLDRDHLLEQFVQDLTDEVRRKRGYGADEEIRFLDTDSIDIGDVWPEKLGNALQTSGLCLSLLSPAYFNSEYCGKEFEVFRKRSCIRQTSASTSAIFPILWERTLGPVPGAVQPYQYSNDDLPQDYPREGLKFLAKLNKYRDDYLLFVDRLATKLASAAVTPLPELNKLGVLSEIPNAFRTPPKDATAVTSGGGPNNVHFVFLAAPAAEFAELGGSRSQLACYENQGGWYWRPYYTSNGVSVGKLAQSTATELDFHYDDILDINDDLIARFAEAERRNEVVVVLADPWTIRLSRFEGLMRQYDEKNLLNCSVLFAWNDDDPDTAGQKQALEQNLSQVFLRKFIQRPPAHEWESIRSARDLNAKLNEVLEKLRMMVLQAGKSTRKAESEEIVEKARVAGVPIRSQPILSTTREGTSHA